MHTGRPIVRSSTQSSKLLQKSHTHTHTPPSPRPRPSRIRTVLAGTEEEDGDEKAGGGSGGFFAERKSDEGGGDGERQRGGGRGGGGGGGGEGGDEGEIAQRGRHSKRELLRLRSGNLPWNQKSLVDSASEVPHASLAQHVVE